MTEPRTLRARLTQRLRRGAERALLFTLGRPLVCADCGRRLFVGLPIVWRGRVKVIGASEYNVRIAFRDKTSLELRHMELDSCPAPERPWVS
jgi:hypothetical protein